MRFGLSLIPEGTVAQPRPETIEDRWILSRLEAARVDIRARIEAFDMSHAALALYDFVYGELCDWYLELVKPRFAEDVEGDQAALASNLLFVLSETLVLAHPVIPFVTETLWPHLPGSEGMLAAHSAPNAAPERADAEAEALLGSLIETVQDVRGWRDAASVPAGGKLAARLNAPALDPVLEQVARLARLDLTAADAPVVATLPVAGGVLEVLEGGAIDPAAAQERVDRQRKALELELAALQKKLSNDGFVSKAPADVVAGEREKVERIQKELEAL
ncbi:unannotated protein [freshwater metagenome]|uniref:valine--tRNA ligase n=1 Tax=freshwater metagenome TaxID=449393 RepID=A0A6J7EET0_9ZZZZ